MLDGIVALGFDGVELGVYDGFARLTIAEFLGDPAGSTSRLVTELERTGLDVVGINLYPLFSLKRLRRSGGRTRMAMPYAPASIVERLATDYHRRYRRPVVITETASEGSVAAARERAEREMIVATLARNNGEVSSAAREMQVSRTTMWRLMKKHGITA